jgi:hypothetical protein
MGLAMSSITKSLALILIGIMAISCMSVLIAKSVSAQTDQTIPRPSAPEFTAKVNASSLEVTIKNQPIIAYMDANGSIPSLYYGFRFKDHANFHSWGNYAPLYYVLPSTYGTYYKASNSDYTLVSFTVGNYPLEGILASGQVDMQVITKIGNELPTNIENGTVYTFDGVTSDWSNTQTITIPASLSSPSPSPTVPEFSWLGILPLIISLFSIAILFRHRKTDNLSK